VSSRELNNELRAQDFFKKVSFMLRLISEDPKDHVLFNYVASMGVPFRILHKVPTAYLKRLYKV